MHECQKQEVIEAIKKDIDNLYSTKDVIIELKTIVKLQVEQNDNQDKILKQQSDILIKISQTVEQQGELLVKLTEKYDILDNKIIKTEYDTLKENSVSFSTIFKIIIDKALPPIVIAGLMYFILEVTNKG